MKLSIPTSYDNKLVNRLSNCNVKQYYSNLPIDFLWSKKRIDKIFENYNFKEHIDKIHSTQCEYSYNLDNQCFGNFEWTRKWNKHFHYFIDKLIEYEVNSITISIPYLVNLVLSQYKSFIKVNISVGARIDCLARFIRWAELDIVELEITASVLLCDIDKYIQISKHYDVCLCVVLDCLDKSEMQLIVKKCMSKGLDYFKILPTTYNCMDNIISLIEFISLT